MSDLLTEYTRRIQEQIAEIEECMVNFLTKAGFDVSNPISAPDLKFIQEELYKQGRQLRCEYFIKFNSDHAVDASRYSFTGLCVPFIDAIDTPMTRAEVYEVLRLQEKGYSYKGENVWL